MHSFPQELVDMVIDQLANGPQRFGDPGNGISWYSTVSRAWVGRTQEYHFKSVHFRGQPDLEKWCTTIEPNPSGVSRHTRELFWWFVNALEGYASHIRALTRVESAVLVRCGILSSPSIAKYFAPMGSTLVRLGIDGGSTTHSIIISLLTALPRLCHLRAHFLDVLDDRDATALHSGVPFFRGANTLDLLVHRDTSGSLDWIPPSAQFRNLWIDVSIIDESGRVKQWLASSASNLKFLRISGRPDGPRFTPLDLSGCAALESLQLGISLPEPGILADTVLPPLYSFPPPKIVLALEGSCFEGVDFRAWEAMGGHLCRAAQQFKATHPRTEMEVEISVGGWGGSGKPVFVEWCKSGEVMLKLMEDAKVVITDRR